MEELTRVLLEIDSNDAVIVANKYITYKYTELFCCLGLIGVVTLIIIIVVGVFLKKA